MIRAILFSMQKPIRAIVGRFSADFSVRIIERVLAQHPFEFCGIISSGVQPRYFQTIPAEQQEWFISSQIRGGQYSDVDWTKLQPLDEELIENMRECEAIFMEIVSRLEWKKRVSYDIRKQWYFRHLRFWNDYLTRQRINLYLSAWIPHEIPDIVIYYLCKLKKIPVVFFGVSAIRDTSFIEYDWEESNLQTGKRFEELRVQYAPESDPLSIPLQERFEQRYCALTRSAGQTPPLEEQEVYVPFRKTAYRLFVHKPFFFLLYALRYLTPSGINRAFGAWRRWRVRRKANAFYNTHAASPDLSHPFVYMPLHYQPEATTVPQAGGYADQILVAQMLNALLPDDVLIYVKEHPRPSGTQKRDADFYRRFANLSKVRFVPRGFDTFMLREHCRATVTAAGTAGFEGLFRGKPVLLFGHCYYQYASGAYRIHTREDCRQAIHSIFAEGKVPTLLECRLLLKAMEETCVHGVTDPFCFNVSRLSKDENAQSCSAAIIEELDTCFGVKA